MGFFSWLEKRRKKKEEKRIVETAIQNIEKLKKSIDDAFENPIHFHHYIPAADPPVRKRKKDNGKRRKRKHFTGNVDKYLRDKCYFDENVTVDGYFMYEDYVDWAQQNGLKYCGNANSFGRELGVVAKGKFNSMREEGQVVYRGIGIKNFVGNIFQ